MALYHFTDVEVSSGDTVYLQHGTGTGNDEYIFGTRFACRCNTLPIRSTYDQSRGEWAPKYTITGINPSDVRVELIGKCIYVPSSSTEPCDFDVSFSWK